MAYIKMTGGDLAKDKDGDLALVVIEISPVDPGDAHGVGNTKCTSVPPDLLHETVEDTQANGTAFRGG